MSFPRTFTTLVLGGCFCLAVAVGCGGDDDSSVSGKKSPTGDGAVASGVGTAAADSTNWAGADQSGADGLTTASIGGANKTEKRVRISDPEPGSPEWLLREITIIRLKPLPESIDEQKAVLAERNTKIVDLATQVIALTHKYNDKERLFNVAVHQLMEGQLQLALQGNRTSIDELYGHAESLFGRDPKSKAAAEAAFVVVKFAHTNARNFAAREPGWLTEFSRQARLFASSFPQEESRAVSLLLAAGRSCDLHGLSDEATACFTAIQQDFPESPQAGQVVSFLRRLNLRGQPLQLAGPTIEGGFVSVDDLRGRVVLVVFWATNAKPFLDQLSQLRAITEQFQPKDLAIIGVNLDNEEPAIDAFLEKNPITWPQIFHTDREHRGWNHPVAVYYGVRNIPMYWLVNRDGTAGESMFDISRLEASLQARLRKPATTLSTVPN